MSPSLPRVRDLLWWAGNKVPGIFFNLLHVPVQIDLFWFQPLRLLIELPENEQQRKDANHSVRKQESWNIPIAR